MNNKIKKILNISSWHLDKSDIDWLCRNDYDNFYTATYNNSSSTNGLDLIIYICSYNQYDPNNIANIPENINNMLSMAVDFGYSILHLHTDGYVFTHLNRDAYADNMEQYFMLSNNIPDNNYNRDKKPVETMYEASTKHIINNKQLDKMFRDNADIKGVHLKASYGWFVDTHKIPLELSNLLTEELSEEIMSKTDILCFDRDCP